MKSRKNIVLRLMQLSFYIFIASAASAQLQARFSGTPLTGCPPMVVSFTDNSTGNPVSWKWDLGNGTISTLQNPLGTYFNAGTYNVKLVVKNAAGTEDSLVKSQYVVVNALPVASFAASDSTGCFPLKVQFADNSLAGSGNIVSWQWDFGDGTLSTLQNPSHTYTNGGNFTVILRVVNSNGCAKVVTKSAYIKISNGVKADFTYTSSAGCSSPAPVTFTNTTNGTGTVNYTWSFGDGGTSTATNPTHNYNGGSYTVQLIASNSFGCRDTMTKPNAISVGFVNSDFTMPATACAGAKVFLINTSTPSSFVGAYWSFGDTMPSTAINPVHVFATPGTYQVKLITDFGACIDSVMKTITIAAKPVAAFTAANTSACTAPLTVSFNATAAGGTFKWLFGDGATSAQQSPSHTYTVAGSYTVKLIVTNASGCTDTLTKTNFVKISPPQIASIDSLPAKGCLPYLFKPIAVMVDSMPVSTYFWNFGDGFTSTSATPSHTYTTSGNFDITLIVSTGPGCTDTLKVLQGVKVGTKPNVHFFANPKDVCANTAVIFTDSTFPAPIHEWFWQFGDGGTSVLQNPSHMYNDTGKFTVTLIAYNFGCSDTLVIENMIHIKPPIAKFDTAFLCNDPLRRNFINNSIGATTSTWDFGDGGTSTVTSPSHLYAASGVYRVILNVSNGTCTHTTKKDVVVIKHSPTMVVSDSTGCLNKRVTIQVFNVVDSNVLKYAWYFNGFTYGATTTSNNPVATTYNTAGIRRPAVVVTNILNCKDTAYALIPVSIYGPKANFSSIIRNTCYGNTINFIDSSKTDGFHPIAQWDWNFGDGIPQTYTAGPFSHNYATSGTYDVKLLVKDTYGCKDSLTKLAYVSITKPTAKFTPSDTILCPGIPVMFTNNSQSENGVYYWSFGDGDTSSAASPAHLFTQPGAYTVKLLLIDKNGCRDSISQLIKVFFAKAKFQVSDSFSTCPPLIVNITNQSTDYTYLNWDFGDGGNSQLLNPSHIYTYPGNYTIKLTVKNNGGCLDTLVRNIIVKGPTGTFTYFPLNLCQPGHVKYSLNSINTVNYVWDFADGTIVYSTTDTVSHIYTSPGSYLPKIIMEDAGGCRVAMPGLDTVNVYGVESHILSNIKKLCDSGYVAFKDSSITNDVITSYLWNFGDGVISSLQNPSHFYGDTGNYTITLTTTTNTGCVSTATIPAPISIASAPAVKILGDTSACAPAKLKFIGQLAAGADTTALSWSWSFGNGVNTNVAVPDSQYYALAGTYPVKVTVNNPTGCSGQGTRQVIIHPNPVVRAGADTVVCRNAPFSLNATGASVYNWSPNSTLSCINCPNPSVTAANDGSYMVTGQTSFGCKASDTVFVRVRQPFAMRVDKGDTVCRGSSVHLNAAGADFYQWTPALYLNRANIANPISVPDTTITYKVMGRDSAGCFRDSGTVKIKVYPKPTTHILNGNELLLEVGKDVLLQCINSPDVTQCIWSPAQWLSCDTCPNPRAMPKDNITYTVTARNNGNCTAKDNITIHLVCGNANVYMPNTFSPNGDGMNDIYYPRGTGLYNIRNFKIFNRWGQAVFERSSISANNPTYGWDGKFNGVKLQPDVYVYLLEVVCANNVVFPFKGNVTLVR